MADRFPLVLVIELIETWNEDDEPVHGAALFAEFGRRRERLFFVPSEYTIDEQDAFDLIVAHLRKVLTVT